MSRSGGNAAGGRGGDSKGRGGGALGVIPARLESTRLPRKPLRPLAGRPLIEWVWRRAQRCGAFDELVVATDSAEIVDAVEGFGGRAVRTRSDHRTGTERVAEVAGRAEYSRYGLIVNLQGDEPFVPCEAIEDAVNLVEAGWDVGTAAAPIREIEEWRDPAAAKVVLAEDGGALYFSRAPIPFGEEGGGVGVPDGALEHIGIYAFPRDVLARVTELPAGRLERLEGLEQLRWLEAGLRIGVAIVDETGPGVDTEEDMKRVEGILMREGEP